MQPPAPLRPQQRALLDFRLRQKTSVVGQIPARPRGPDPRPLSFAQERMWFLWRIEPESSAYNGSLGLRMKGMLNREALEKALNEVRRRHDVLRSCFPAAGGVPVQIARPWVREALPCVSLDHFGTAEGEEGLRHLARQFVFARHDLETSPAMRATLVQLSPAEHVLVVGFHHIVFDAWSRQVLHGELERLYSAFARERVSPLADLPVQYADFAQWQRHQSTLRQYQGDMVYWRKHLAGELPVLDLPIARLRPSVRSYRGAAEERWFPPPLIHDLKALFCEEGATLFMGLLAALKTLFHRYTGEEDLIVGGPVAGRTLVEVEPLIGCFLNTLAFRSRVESSRPFRELLRAERRCVLDAFDHQSAPFEQVVEMLNPSRELSRAPVFQTLLNLRNVPASTARWGDLEVTRWEFEDGVAQFDLSFEAEETADGLRFTCLYSTELFEAEDIRRLLEHFEVLLRSIARQPDAPVGRLDLLPATERQRVVKEFNATHTHFPATASILELFEQQARRTPQAVAVEDGQGSLSFHELDTRANTLARHLRSRGVEPGVLVGLGLERSLDWIVGLLGVLKAGGAYLPLDPSYPAERLNFMVEDSRLKLILTQASLAHIWPRVVDCLCLDRGWEEIARSSAHTSPAPPSMGDPAYVIYTSGSTGQPKGVMIHHGALANFLCWVQSRFPVESADVVLQTTPNTFDISIVEIFLPLLSGAKLLLARPGGQRELRYLAELIQARSVTVAQFVPSTLELLIEEPGFANCTSLRRVFCGGEVMPLQLMYRFQQVSSAQLVNIYGPTETTIWSTVWVCDPKTLHRSPPIGTPVANTQAYVLDQQLAPQPIGVPGELFIGGAQVGLGYLCRPELTAERFIPDPFSTQDEARLYRTGDRCRWSADGTLEFLGRLDDQVKIRGVRVELGEVEAALRTQPDIKEAAVAVRQEAGRTTLRAGVVPRAGAKLESGALRAHLAARLPEAMVPGEWLILENLPRLPNGKTNRRALAERLLTEQERPNTREAPGSEVERKLGMIWENILRHSPVGLKDDFFELGGHSLLAMRMVAQVRQIFDVDLPLRCVFESPTLAGLAAVLANIQKATGDCLHSRIAPLDRQTFRKGSC